MIREQAIRQRTATMWMNAAGFAIYLAIILCIAVMVSFLLAPPSRVWLFALLGTAFFLAVGLAVKYRGYAGDADAVTGYWQVGSVGEYLVRREVLMVTGTAHVVSEIIMGAATCLYALLIAQRKRALIMRLSEQDILAVVRPFIASARQGTRFLNPEGMGLDAPTVAILLANDVLWASHEGGTLRLGVNRRYDGAA
jgi:hypothetical protein